MVRTGIRGTVRHNARRNAAHRRGGYEKVYLSRNNLTPGKRIFGEEKIQEIFQRNGFKIIYPETLPLGDQIRIISNADVIAGCAGTALHLALVMRPGGTVIQLKRNRAPRDNALNQLKINEIVGLKSVFISASVEPSESKHSTVGAQIIGMTPHLRRFFEENNYELIPSDFTADTDAMNEYTQYLKTSHVKYKKLKNIFIKIVACFVPGRINRARVRNWLKRVI